MAQQSWPPGTGVKPPRLYRDPPGSRRLRRHPQSLVHAAIFFGYFAKLWEGREPIGASRAGAPYLAAPAFAAHCRKSRDRCVDVFHLAKRFRHGYAIAMMVGCRQCHPRADVNGFEPVDGSMGVCSGREDG